MLHWLCSSTTYTCRQYLWHAEARDGIPACSVNMLSPEMVEFQLHGDQNKFPDYAKHDCWSLGCILVWLVTGQVPFTCSYSREANMADKMKAMREQHHTWVRIPDSVPLAHAAVQYCCFGSVLLANAAACASGLLAMQMRT